MPQNDNVIDDGILDPLDIDEGSSSSDNKNYVPKFERDLAAMGSLEALSAAKKAEAEGKTAPAVKTEEAAEEEPDDDHGCYIPDGEESEYEADNDPAYQYHTKPREDYSDRPAPKSFADFAKEAEAEERAKAEAEKNKPDSVKSLDGISIDASAMLSDMDYKPAKDKSNSLLKQMQMDDLAMEMDSKPVISEMSDEYMPTQKNAEDLAAKDTLDRDEKQLIKDRLEQEIGKRPEDYNKRESVEMYRSLMHEQKVKKAKKGRANVIIFAVIGIAVAAVMRYVFNWTDVAGSFSDLTVRELLTYLPAALVLFSLLMIVKSRTVKFISGIFFGLNTILLVWPGLINFVMDTNQNPSDYIITLVFYVISIIVCAYIAVKLFNDENINAYYITNMKKKAAPPAQPAKPVVKTVRRK